VLAIHVEPIKPKLSIEPTRTLIRNQLLDGLNELQRCIAENDGTSFNLHLQLCQLDSLNTHLELCSPEYLVKYVTSQ
jgi:hypothetical protein